MIETLYLTDSDELRERKIKSELASMQCCQALGNRRQAAVHWTNAAALIKQRSQARVKRMEVERGIT